jgi:lysophospholipase
LNDTDGSFGFDTENGEEDGMSFLFSQLSSHTESDVKDAANWPNVRTNVSTHTPTDSTYLQPFKGINPATFEDSSSDWLELLDGGSNHEKAPLSSLLVKARELDVIVVIDGSADDSNYWPK